MNLTWHIVKKDLRALKWPLAAWALVIVAKLGVGVAMLTATGSLNSDWLATWFAEMDTVVKVLSGLECVSFVLVAALIHEDLLVGTTAFWVTRPISGGRLLRAKVLGIVLIFGFLPVLVTLPWWLACHYGTSEIVWAALETVAIQAICVLLGLLWAVVTDGFARFLLWSLVLLLGVPSLMSLIGLHITNAKVQPTPDLLLTRVWVAIAIALLAITAVTVHQFLTRRTERSVAAIVLAFGLIIMTGLWWPWDLQVRSRWNAYRTERVDKELVLTAEPAGLQFEVEPQVYVERGGRLRELILKLGVTGLPDGRELAGYRSRYSLDWPDGTHEIGRTWPRRSDRLFTHASRKALGLADPETAKTDEQRFLIPVSLSPATATRVQTEPPGLMVKSFFQMLKIENATRYPLEPGSRFWVETTSERIAHVEVDGPSILVSFIKTRPDFAVDQLTTRSGWDRPVFSMLSLFNQSAGVLQSGSSLTGRSSRVATVLVSVQVMAYTDAPPPGKKPRLLQDVMRSTELVRQTFAVEASFSHDLKVDRFPVAPAHP